MKIISIDALDSLLYCLNEKSQVFWMRDKTYSKQLYISPSYESVWEMPCSTLYNNPSIFKDTINPDEYSQQILTLQTLRSDLRNDQGESQNNKQSEQPLLWRIKTNQGHIKYIYDAPFKLIDAQGHHIGFGGVGGELSQEEWFELYYAQKNQKSLINPEYKKAILDILKHETGITTSALIKSQMRNNQIAHGYLINNGSQKIALTKRESECAYYLMRGFRRKERPWY